jgi:SAM-dependent methyltransferase
VKLSHSAQESGWRDYPATIWKDRKPLDWLPDWPFWHWCAKTFSCGQPILELACGHGRITRQLALHGWRVVAVDMNPHFLNWAQDVIDEEIRDQVTFVLQDVVHLDLEYEPFHLSLMTDWAFPAILTQADQREFLRRVADHLLPGGVFAFNTPFATAQQLGLQPTPDGEGLYWPGENRHFDPLAQIETRYSGHYPLKFRHNTLDELRLVAELAGFTVLEVFGGVDKRPLRGLPGDDLTLILRKQ